MANTEINPFAYNPAVDTSVFGAPPSQEDPEELDISQYLPARAPQAQAIQGKDSSYNKAFQQAESQYRLPSGLLSTMGFHESRFNPNAVSPAGAEGVMQLMPPTAREYGVNARDPYASIDAAGKKMSGLVKYYNGDIAKAVAAYNFGEGNLNRAIKKAGENWLSAVPPETQSYVSKVLGDKAQAPQGPQEDTYPIPLASGRTLYAPKGMPREEALASARAQGVDAVGLRDIPLASGKTLQVPEHLSDEEAIKQASEAHPDIDFTIAESEEPGRFEAALRRSGEGFKQTLQGIGLGTSAALDGEDTQAKMDALKAAQAKEGPGPKSMSVQDIQDIYNKEGVWAAAKELPGFAGEKILESSASTAAPLAVGMAAGAVFPPVGIAAGIATAVVQQFGDFIGRQAQENMDAGELDPGIAVVGAIPAGVLDFVTDKFTFGLGMGAKQAAKAAAVDEIKKSVISKVGTHALKGAVLEPVTEVGQQVLERAQARLPVTGEEAGREYKEAAGTALAAGTVQGAVGGVNQAVQERTQEPDEGLLNNGQPIMAPEQPITPEGVPVQEVPVSAEIAPNEALATEEEEVPLPGVLAAKTRAAREELDALRAAQTDTGEAVQQGAVQQGAVQQGAVQQGAVQQEDAQEEPKVRGQWVKDVFGVKESSGIFKKLKDLDIDNPADHPAIDAQLDTLKTIKAPQYEAITQRMDAAKATQPEIQPQVQPEIQPQVQPQVQQPEGVQPSANQIPEATTPDVSSSAQPKILQEGESAPISGEGVREGRPETGQAKEEKVEPFRYSVTSEDTYKSQHRPPSAENGAPLHDVTKGGEIYPADIYSSKGLQYYGTGQDRADKESLNVIKNTKDKPDALVTMYRAVPKDSSITTINNGDWVTLSKTYAKEHGESALDDDYKIVSKKVKASQLFTNGDSINEFGYWEGPPKKGEAPPYSVAPTPEGTGHTSASLYETLSPEMKRLVDSGKAVIHDTAETLPAGKHPENVQGLTTAEGVTHYVANKLTPETIQKVALHEVGVHAGMEKMVGAKTWDNVKSQAMTNKGEAFDRARTAVPKNTPEHLKAEETLAYLVENSPELPIVKRIISSVRNFARVHLGMKVGLTEADARHLAVSALRRESKTAERTARKETAFSKEKLLAPNGKPSNLNAMQHAQVRTPAFKKWFGDWENDPENASKVVDENGEPLVVYHKTRAFKDFTEFDPTKSVDGWDIHFGTKEAANNLSLLGDKTDTRIIPAFLNIKHMPHTDHDDGHWGQHQLIDAWEKYWTGLPTADKKRVRDMQISDGLKTQYGLGFGKYIKNKAIDIAKSGTRSGIILPKFMADEMFKYGMTGLSYRNAFEDKGSTSYIVMDPRQIKSAIGNTGEFSTENPDIRYSVKQPSESNKDLGKKLADSGLVKTSDKSIVDSVKEGFNNFKGSSISKEYSKIQTSFVDSSAGLRRALSDLDTFDMNGKLRADMLHSKFDQIYNIIRESFNSGPVVLSSDGGVMASENKQLALRDIFKRIDSLKFDEPRGTFFTVMRISAGEENLRKDIVNRGIANDAIEAANNLDEFAKDVSDKVKYGQLKAQSAALRKEAKKILDRVGVAPEVDGIRLGTEKLVTKEHIDQARSLLDKNPEMAPIMADIYSLLRASVDLWEKTGLVNNEVANEWRSNPSYIPLYKSMDDLYDDPNEYIKVLKSGPKSIKEVKRLEGGTHAVNVGENLVKHITFMTGAAAQNQLRKAAVSNLSMVDDTVKRTHPDDKQAVMFKVDGKKVYYHIDDPMVLEALETAMPSLAAWAKFTQPYTKVFRTATLVNPLYWYRQVIRDPLHANLVSQTGIVHPGQAMVAMAQIIAGEAGLKSKTFKNYEALKRQGVVGAVDALTDTKQFIKAAASKPGGVKKFGAWVMRIHEASDAATRVIVYEAGLKEAKQRGLSGQKAQNFATMRAREIINFAKKGNSEAIANIRATVPFFSSALNSMDTIARAATGMGLNKKEAARARKMFATRALVLASVSAAWALHLQDDEDYIKSPDWVNSWLIPTGLKDSPFWKLPIPFEAGFFFKVLPELMVRLVSGTLTPKEARGEAGKSAMQLLVPPVPFAQIFKPALEVVGNYDTFTKRPIESVADLSKTKEQRDSKASDLAKFVSKATPLSPNQIEHLGKGYFTELWAVTALLAENFLHEGPAKPEKYLGEIPIIKGVFTKPEQDKTVNQFYEIEKAAAEISNTIKGARKTGEKKVYEEMMADPEKAKLFRAYPSLNNTSDRISKLRKNIERIKNDPATTPAEKTKRIRGVQQQINKAAEQGMATAKRLKLDI
jgi:hypothetical protein